MTRFRLKCDSKPILNLPFIGDMWSSEIIEGIMLAKEQIKKLDQGESVSDRFAVKARLNLNDLLRRRVEEKKLDKKTNLIILSSVTTVAAVVVLILSL